ncbi:MAG: uracil-DNA glycosylase family protein [Muribaculaceae bacterium]|nr:uracil-DNA glycosylase family protein [Muribaculaceae bacterium]
MDDKVLDIEVHPWEPFIPEGARILIMGTFPPGRHRWAMDFYYPNRTNDFWPMMGLIFYGDRYALYDKATRTYRLDAIKALLTEKGIALNDTGRKVRRLRGNASDKYLDIIEPAPLGELLAAMPLCHTVATTGEKAAEVVASLTGTVVPPKGGMVCSQEGLNIWRMPSTSRAYPLPLEQKAEYYRRMFEAVLEM